MKHAKQEMLHQQKKRRKKDSKSTIYKKYNMQQS